MNHDTIATVTIGEVVSEVEAWDHISIHPSRARMNAERSGAVHVNLAWKLYLQGCLKFTSQFRRRPYPLIGGMLGDVTASIPIPGCMALNGHVYVAVRPDVGLVRVRPLGVDAGTA